MKREVTIATPCFNEQDSLPGYFRRIDAVRARLREQGWNERLLLIDDGSSDLTPELLTAYARLTPGTEVAAHPANWGYGAAIKTALALASTEWVVFVDADTNYDQSLILELARRAGPDTDILNVSIFAPGGTSAFERHRRLLSRAASLIYRTLLPRLTAGIYTMTCGFRWYRRAIVPAVFPELDGFAATSEILLRARLAGLRVEEVPARNCRREQGVSKMRFVGVALTHLGLALRALGGRLGPPASVAAHAARLRGAGS